MAEYDSTEPGVYQTPKQPKDPLKDTAALPAAEEPKVEDLGAKFSNFGKRLKTGFNEAVEQKGHMDKASSQMEGGPNWGLMLGQALSAGLVGGFDVVNKTQNLPGVLDQQQKALGRYNDMLSRAKKYQLFLEQNPKSAESIAKLGGVDALARMNDADAKEAFGKIESAQDVAGQLEWMEKAGYWSAAQLTGFKGAKDTQELAWMVQMEQVGIKTKEDTEKSWLNKHQTVQNMVTQQYQAATKNGPPDTYSKEQRDEWWANAWENARQTVSTQIGVDPMEPVVGDFGKAHNNVSMMLQATADTRRAWEASSGTAAVANARKGFGPESNAEKRAQAVALPTDSHKGMAYAAELQGSGEHKADVGSVNALAASLDKYKKEKAENAGRDVMDPNRKAVENYGTEVLGPALKELGIDLDGEEITNLLNKRGELWLDNPESFENFLKLAREIKPYGDYTAKEVANLTARNRLDQDLKVHISNIPELQAVADWIGTKEWSLGPNGEITDFPHGYAEQITDAVGKFLDTSGGWTVDSYDKFVQLQRSDFYKEMPEQARKEIDNQVTQQWADPTSPIYQYAMSDIFQTRGEFLKTNAAATAAMDMSKVGQFLDSSADVGPSTYNIEDLAGPDAYMAQLWKAAYKAAEHLGMDLPGANLGALGIDTGLGEGRAARARAAAGGRFSGVDKSPLQMLQEGLSTIQSPEMMKLMYGSEEARDGSLWTAIPNDVLSAEEKQILTDPRALQLLGMDASKLGEYADETAGVIRLDQRDKKFYAAAAHDLNKRSKTLHAGLMEGELAANDQIHKAIGFLNARKASLPEGTTLTAAEQTQLTALIGAQAKLQARKTALNKVSLTANNKAFLPLYGQVKKDTAVTADDFAVGIFSGYTSQLSEIDATTAEKGGAPHLHLP